LGQVDQQEDADDQRQHQVGVLLTGTAATAATFFGCIAAFSSFIVGGDGESLAALVGSSDFRNQQNVHDDQDGTWRQDESNHLKNENLVIKPFLKRKN